ncbi:hypothetical protein E3Q22_01096 [Wallemia mellicola]|uniref:Uncharacterized protein n=1 Tax=Wallemia mellicola TaxID=1708541 RepID=A0A4T0Q288_9BASI|nr:hypothetical protein E3Q24_03456 [Wallemia mellicola]TIB76210.1 hypothetical protein E3Q23_01940 [Wallemia mellicola]TIB81334.1 hypothetical protein E3Q22_01096 [Wallemia mellicola]TIB88778.1 hypothetical protein E3Q21_00811 [Wallemia mellicola]TIB91419.1 hypothetical protein E3Q20_00797 [Wallemia mellicola]
MSLYTLKSQSVDVNTALNEQSHIEALSDIINNQKDNLIHLSITIIKTDNNNLNYLYESISRLNKLRSISIFYEEDEEIEQNNSDRLAKLITVLPKTTKIVYLFSGWYTAWNELLSAEFEHLRIRIWNEEDNPIRPYHLQRFNALIESNTNIKKIEIETSESELCGFYQKGIQPSMAFINPSRKIKVHNWFKLRNLYA